MPPDTTIQPFTHSTAQLELLAGTEPRLDSCVRPCGSVEANPSPRGGHEDPPAGHEDSPAGHEDPPSAQLGAYLWVQPPQRRGAAAPGHSAGRGRLITRHSGRVHAAARRRATRGSLFWPEFMEACRRHAVRRHQRHWRSRTLRPCTSLRAPRRVSDSTLVDKHRTIQPPLTCGETQCLKECSGREIRCLFVCDASSAMQYPLSYPWTQCMTLPV